MGKVIDLPVRPVKNCAGNPLEVVGSLSVEDNYDGLDRAKGSEDTDPGVPVKLIDFTNPLANTRVLLRLKVTCSRQGFWDLQINGTSEATGRTDPGEPDTYDPWKKGLKLSGGETVRLFFTATTGPVVPVQGYLEFQDI